MIVTRVCVCVITPSNSPPLTPSFSLCNMFVLPLLLLLLLHHSTYQVRGAYSGHVHMRGVAASDIQQGQHIAHSSNTTTQYNIPSSLIYITSPQNIEMSVLLRL